MSKPQIVSCDECPAQKRDVNHWFSLINVNRGGMAHPLLATFEDAERIFPAGILRRDYCGRECLFKGLHRWLGTGSILKAETKSAVSLGNREAVGNGDING